MIFKSLLWIAIAAAGSVASADNANQVVDDDIKLIKAAQKVSEWDVPGLKMAEPSPKINLTQFHPPAELLPKSGDPVALILLCKPGKLGNLTQIERQTAVTVHHQPKMMRRNIEAQIILNNVYFKYPECGIFWNGENIFKGSVEIKMKPTLKMHYQYESGFRIEAKIMKKDCELRRGTSGPMQVVEREAHAFKKDGKSDPMATYLINHLLPGRSVMVMNEQWQKLARTVLFKLMSVLVVGKDNDNKICHRIASLL